MANSTEELGILDDVLPTHILNENTDDEPKSQSTPPQDLNEPKDASITKTMPNEQVNSVPNITGTTKTPAHEATANQANVNIISDTLPTQTHAPAAKGPELFPIVIKGNAPTKSSITLTKLEKLPILNEVIVRDKEKFQNRREENISGGSLVVTERGTIAEKACHECSRGKGPFTLCCVVEGMFKQACGNCHYGGNASRCSFYRDHQNAVALLTAREVDAPEIPGMAPANYTGGSIAKSGFTLNGPAGVPLLQHLPVPQFPTLGVARGSKGQRLAPTPAPQFGFGSTDESRLAHARSLTSNERKATADRLKAELEAIEKIMAEENVSDVTKQCVESKGTKRKQDEMNEN